jgi:phytoene dehydrogenase-like protein
MEKRKKVIIVGGGLAGLACAVTLRQGGVDAQVLESSDGVGGRVRTDSVNGFLLDRGFQVYLSAYPEAERMLDLKALDLRRFRAGALVFRNRKMHRMMDVFRHPRYLIGSALAPIGTLGDKWRVAKLRFTRRGASRSEDRSTEKFLRDFGFSDGMIDGFFRAFYGGIFLERELRTSSRMFEFTFQMFTDGYATLPAKGMQAIPEQLAARMPSGSIHLNIRVGAVEKQAVLFESGERWEADAVVLATDAKSAQGLLPESGKEVSWRSVTVINFSAPRSPLNEAIIALNGDGDGLVNNVCVISDVVPEYAPVGKSLISVSVLGVDESNDLESRVLAELETWFGPQVRAWEHLRTDRIKQALPEQPTMPLKKGIQKQNDVFLCGDYCTSASIEGAIESGKDTAAAVLASLK